MFTWPPKVRRVYLATPLDAEIALPVSRSAVGAEAMI